MRGSSVAGVAAIAGVMAFNVVPAEPVQAQPVPAAEEIVVTARRIGIPVWRVTGPTTSIVLIGSIEGIAKSTRWDPGALEMTLRKADRVMFPNSIGLTGSPFSLIGYYVKWRKQATLPKGKSLADYLPRNQFQRLVALKNRGVLKAGFERTHPLHLALELRKVAEGRGHGPDVDRYVRATVKKHKVKTVPIATLKAKPILNDFFSTPPQTYTSCLIDAIAVAEAGPAAVKARSDAWAERRVPAVLSSPADKIYETCSPVAWGILPRTDLRTQIGGLMSQTQVTVAVVNLRSLAARGGILDSLAAGGFKISGPTWR